MASLAALKERNVYFRWTTTLWWPVDHDTLVSQWWLTSTQCSRSTIWTTCWAQAGESRAHRSPGEPLPSSWVLNGVVLMTLCGSDEICAMNPFWLFQYLSSCFMYMKWCCAYESFWLRWNLCNEPFLVIFGWCTLFKFLFHAYEIYKFLIDREFINAQK